MKAPECLPTPRLILRRPVPQDADAIFTRYTSDREVIRYLGWPRHRSVDDTRAFLEFSAAEWERWPAGPYLIESRESGVLLGGTGFGFESPHCAVTGYVLARDAWGQGYATEALTALLTLCTDLSLQQVHALCHPDHFVSQRVLIKCGFVRDDKYSETTYFPNLESTLTAKAVRFVRTI